MSLFSESADGFLLSTNLLIVSPQIVLQRGHVPSLVLPLLVSQQPRTHSLPSNPKAPWEDNLNQWYVYAAIYFRFYFFIVRVCTRTRALPSLAWQEMAENGGGGQLTVKARFNFKQNNEDELSFNKGDMIVVTRQEEGGWWEGTLNGKTGWFPSNYVREIKQCGELGQGRCSIDPLLALRSKEVLCVWLVFASGFGVALERRQCSHMFIRCRETSVSKGNSADQELLQCGK